MNLTEFVRKNDIKCKDDAEFDHSPDFFKMKEFERKRYRICKVPFLMPETYEVGTFDVRLSGEIQEKWDKAQKRTQRQFFINRSFYYPGITSSFDTIEDSVAAGKTVDEAVEMLSLEIERFLFFKRYDLIDTGRYWLNKDLRRCLVDDGKVVVID